MSIRFALRGVLFCIKYERNSRIHLVFALTIAILTPYFDLTLSQIISIVTVTLLVFAAEALNTAIEIVVDCFINKHDKNAGNIKDISAGGVLVVFICQVVTVAGYLWQPENIFFMIKDLFFSFKLIFSIFYIIISMSFIYFVKEKNTSGKV